MDSSPPHPNSDTNPIARVHRPVKGSWLQLFNYPFEWNRVTLPVANLSPALSTVRILHLTDLHLRARWRTDLTQLVSRLEQEKPDLLLVTGDFVDSKRNHRPALPTLYRLLESFRAPLGCFGVLGNHDRYGLIPRLVGTNVRLIENERVLVPVGDTAIELIGIAGVDRRDLDHDFLRSLPPRHQTPAGSVRIVLAHFPDHIRRTAGLQPDLFLAGHTHGGQVCLPGGTPIIKHDSLPRRLTKGVHRVGPTWLVVGRGLGVTTLPIRFCCPAEVLEIRLAAQPAEASPPIGL